MVGEIRAVLNASPARRRAPGVDVWLLDQGPWWRWFRAHAGLERTKLSLLQAAWRLPLPLFLLPEEPVDPALTPFLARDAPAWRIDRTRSAESFYRTEPASGLGNWQLYAAAKPVGVPCPDGFRAHPAAILRFMQEHAVILFIDVFHDDTDWCIAFVEPAPARSSPV